jgi:hypothetical protein
MLGFLIRIRLNPDLFDQIRIFQGAMAVCGAIFHAHIPIGIRVVANPPTPQQTVALKRPIFKREKGFRNLRLGLIYYSIT